MFTSLLAPFMPYILGGIGVAALALFAYIRWLIRRKGALQEANAVLKQAAEANAKALAKYAEQIKQYEQERQRLEELDTTAKADKQQALDAAKNVTGSDSDALTQEDLDKINAAKKKRKS